jgi:hypothetical protein
VTVFLEVYGALQKRYGISCIRIDISDVSSAFSRTECERLRGQKIYLGRAKNTLGVLSAMLKEYKDVDRFASEYASRHLSDLNHAEGLGRYTIFGTELKAGKTDHRKYVLESLFSDELKRIATNHYVASLKSRIDGVSGLKGIALGEMMAACEISGASLRNFDLILLGTDENSLKNIEKNLNKRLLMLSEQKEN